MEQKYEEFYYDLSHKEERWDQGDNKRMVDAINFKDGSFLEIGCGTASIIPFLSPDISYTGIDISDLAIERAKKLWRDRSNTNFICSSIDNLKLSKNSFNSVAAFNSLEHVRTPKQMLDLMVCVLKPGGNIILTGPNLDLPWSIPNGIRHYNSIERLLFRIKRIGDYTKRVTGILPFRTIPENFTEATGKYEKPDDDLRHVLSSYEVITYLQEKNIEITYVPPFPSVNTPRDLIKKTLTLLPGMKYYGRHFTVIGKKK